MDYSWLETVISILAAFGFIAVVVLVLLVLFSL